MKKYINKCPEMRTLVFEDGSAQFLGRGHSITTDKNVKSVPQGVVVKDVEVAKPVKAPKATAATE